MTLKHKHHDVIDNESHIGTCQICGQQRYYAPDGKSKPVIIKEGVEPAEAEPVNTQRGADMEAGMKPKKKLTAEDRQELLEAGPEAFARKYGYTKRGMGRLVQIYKQLKGSPNPDTTPPAVITKLLEYLPEPGTVMKKSTREALVTAFDALLDLVYKGEEKEEPSGQEKRDT